VGIVGGGGKVKVGDGEGNGTSVVCERREEYNIEVEWVESDEDDISMLGRAKDGIRNSCSTINGSCRATKISC
jgi:hypothetical protein